MDQWSLFINLSNVQFEHGIVISEAAESLEWEAVDADESSELDIMLGVASRLVVMVVLGMLSVITGGRLAVGEIG